MTKNNDFILNEESYHSSEANKRWLDCSTYKNFVGTAGRSACECRALAIAKGEYVPPKTDALLLGSYVDSYFDHSLPQFMLDNMEYLYTKASIKKFQDGKGDLELLSQFKQADAMIKRAIKDHLFMRYVDGETQKIFTAEIAGKYEVKIKHRKYKKETIEVLQTFETKKYADLFCKEKEGSWVEEIVKSVPIRVKLDSYDGKRITDIKTASSISETYYAKDLGQRLNFIEYFGYVEQAFFYQYAVEYNTGKKLPFYLAVISKDKEYNIPHPRLAVIQIPDKVIAEKGEEIKQKIHSVWSLIQGEYEPVPCKHCEWCADNLALERVISMDELMLDV